MRRRAACPLHRRPHPAVPIGGQSVEDIGRVGFDGHRDAEQRPGRRPDGLGRVRVDGLPANTTAGAGRLRRAQERAGVAGIGDVDEDHHHVAGDGGVGLDGDRSIGATATMPCGVTAPPSPARRRRPARRRPPRPGRPVRRRRRPCPRAPRAAPASTYTDSSATPRRARREQVGPSMTKARSSTRADRRDARRRRRCTRGLRCDRGSAGLPRVDGRPHQGAEGLGVRTARSARTLRSTSTPAIFRPAMNCSTTCRSDGRRR